MKLLFIIATLVVLIVIVFGGIWLSKNWDSAFVSLQQKYYQLQYADHQNYASSIETIAISSQILGLTKEVKIYLPVAYKMKNNKKFPTLYLLHGYPGSNSDWLTNTDLQSKLDKMINERKMPPVIVIFPDANGTIVHDSQYVNATKVNQRMEDYLMNELIPTIDKKYRVNTNRHYRAIGGLSSGAYGAMNIGLRHNDMFGFIISHSGYFINRESAVNDLFGNDKNAIDTNNPLNYINKLVINKDTFIYIDIGKDDNKAFLQDNKALDNALTTKKVSHTLRITQGWHNWNVWSTNIPISLCYLNAFWKTNTVKNTFEISKNPACN